MTRLDVNTTSKTPTHFLRGVELIYNGMEEYNIPSENWPSPTGYTFGSPQQRYYAEIWVNGMDWQPTYWIIEEKELEKPTVYPLIIFSDNEDRSAFDDFDFGELLTACMQYRRDKFWVKHDDLSIYSDTVWPFLNIFTKKPLTFKCMKDCYFQHASQPLVTFSMNLEFIPELYREKNSNNRNAKSEYIRPL